MAEDSICQRDANYVSNSKRIWRNVIPGTNTDNQYLANESGSIRNAEERTKQVC